MIPAPPPPVGAPENVLGAWALLAQKWTREQQARDVLAVRRAALAPHGPIKAAEEDLAFAENETANARELYHMELEDAYPSDRKTA
jgi:hypothetical protein